jgi:hypothetical protein
MPAPETRTTNPDAPYGEQIKQQEFMSAARPQQAPAQAPASRPRAGTSTPPVLPLEPPGPPIDPELESLLLLPTQRPGEPVTFGLSDTSSNLSSLMDELLATNPATPDLLALAEDLRMLGL